MSKYADRVKETTTTTGTAAIALGGAQTGFRSFSSAYAVGDSVPYAVSSSGGSEWEVGYGTFTGTTITRDTVLASSNSNALVNFSAGTKDVFATFPAASVVDFGMVTALRMGMGVQ